MHRVRGGFRAAEALGVLLSGPNNARRRPARQPEPALPRLLSRRERAAAHGARQRVWGTWADIEPVATPNIDRLARRVGALRPPLVGIACRACRRGTTSSSVRSTSCGGRGARSRSGRTRSPTTCGAAGVTTMLVSDHPHLFEVGGENYHTDFTAWAYVRGHEGDPWRTRPDPTWTGTPALPAAPGFVHHPYDDSPHVVPCRGGVPGTAHDAGGGGVVAHQRPRPRALPAVRRRVRPARAVRHARAVGDALRRRMGRAASDLAAVFDADDGQGRASSRTRRARSVRTTSRSWR